MVFKSYFVMIAGEKFVKPAVLKSFPKFWGKIWRSNNNTKWPKNYWNTIHTPQIQDFTESHYSIVLNRCAVQLFEVTAIGEGKNQRRTEEKFQRRAYCTLHWHYHYFFRFFWLKTILTGFAGCSYTLTTELKRYIVWFLFVLTCVGGGSGGPV